MEQPISGKNLELHKAFSFITPLFLLPPNPFKKVCQLIMAFEWFPKQRQAMQAESQLKSRKVHCLASLSNAIVIVTHFHIAAVTNDHGKSYYFFDVSGF